MVWPMQTLSKIKRADRRVVSALWGSVVESLDQPRSIDSRRAPRAAEKNTASKVKTLTMWTV